MRAPASLVLSLGLALGGAGAFLAARPGSAAPGDVKFAVVDVLTVINDSPQKTTIEQRQKERETQFKEFGDRENAKLNALKAELVQLTRSSPLLREKQDAFARAKAAFEVEVKLREAHALDAYTDDLENLYRDVKAVVGQVARDQGYQAVFFKTDEPFSLRSPSMSEFIVNVGMRTVVWSETSIDLTAPVLERMRTLVKAPPVGPTPGGTRPPAPLTVPPPAPPGPLPPPGLVPPVPPGTNPK